MALMRSSIDKWMQPQQQVQQGLPQPEGPSEVDQYRQAMNMASQVAGQPSAMAKAPDWLLKLDMGVNKFKANANDKLEKWGDNLSAIKSLLSGGM
jgi:hypothetical protein